MSQISWTQLFLSDLCDLELNVTEILLFSRKKDDTVIGNVVSTLIWIRPVTILPLQLANPIAFILTACHFQEWASHYHCNTWLLDVTCNKTSFPACMFLLIKHLVWKYKDLVLSTHDDCIHVVHSKTGRCKIFPWEHQWRDDTDQAVGHTTKSLSRTRPPAKSPSLKKGLQNIIDSRNIWL